MIRLILVGLLAIFPDDAPPSPQALFQQFRENCDQFHTLNVQWKRQALHTDDWRLAQTKRLEQIQTQMEAMETAQPNGYEDLRKEAQNIQTQIANQQNVSPEYRALLRDGERFLIKTAPAGWSLTHDDQNWALPEPPVTPASMEVHYVGFAFHAHRGKPEEGYRIWTVVGSGNPGYGQVSASLTTIAAGSLCPPLIVPSSVETVGHPIVHPIDNFFRDDPAAFRTVGRSTIDGHDTVILEKRTPTRGWAAQVDAKTGQRLREEDVVRAYIDPIRGALPLRIEWDTQRFLDGQPMPEPKGHRPHRVLEVTEIRKVDGGGFYPTRCRQTMYAEDPKHDGPGNTPEARIAGTLLEIPSVAMEETTWTVGKVTTTLPPGETFALEFPPKAHYYNELTGYSGRVGDEFLDGAQLPWTLCGAMAAGWSIYAVIAGLRFLFARHRRQATPSAA